MKNLVTFLSIVGVMPFCISARTVNSPDGKLVVTTDVDGTGRPVYSVIYDGKIMLEKSPLGFKSNLGDFSSGMSLRDKHSRDTVNREITQDRIKKSRFRYNANRLTENYVTPDGKKMAIEWSVSDNDVAFRYLVPVQGDTRSMIITEEATGFRLPDKATAFVTPQSDAMIGWKRTKPSYEENYIVDAPVSTRSQYGHGFTFPALFRIGDDGWALVSETWVDGRFCGSRLSDNENGVYTVAYPMPEENNGNGNASPAIALPGKTPWRTITVGENLAPIVETVIPWAVVEPRYETESPARPGRGTWSWLLWQDNSINAKDQKAFIDLAAEMGYENVLIDNWWDRNIGRDGIKELVGYASSKGVDLILWYSSSGYWNDIEQSPTNLMDRPVERKKEFKWLKELGISKVKVDFFGGDKQETMRLYEDILSDAADYGIDVIFHGCTLPRGWERLYPNYVGSEAVLASENLVFSQDFCDAAPFNATLHPFIRNAVGCMEYGGTVLNKRLNRGNDGGNYRRTGDAFELATAILFQNPVQNFALAPNNLTDAPADAIEFMKKVPTTWDDVHFIDGYPGRYAVIARRHGDSWYVAGVNAGKEPLKLKLDLSSIVDKNDVMTLYADKEGRQLKAETLEIKKADAVPVTILPAGGLVLVKD